MKKVIEIPEEIVEKLKIKAAKNTKCRKRYGVSNYIVELLENEVKKI